MILILFIFAADQATKAVVSNALPLGGSHPVIEHFFYITHIVNHGAAMGMFQNGRFFLIPMTILIALVMTFYLIKSKQFLLRLTLSLILGGALGNLFDRIVKGGVVDFLDFRFGAFDFWIFNVSDIFVVTGTILFAIYLIFIQKDRVITQ